MIGIMTFVFRKNKEFLNGKFLFKGISSFKVLLLTFFDVLVQFISHYLITG